MGRVPDPLERLQRIKVIGIGGGGSNAVRRMIEAGIPGVEFIAINTSLKELAASRAPVQLHVGAEITHGLSTGGDVALGIKAAEAARPEIEKILENADMVFIAVALGGGTGTGVAPVVAQIAKSKGILTVAVATKPFSFEGARRAQVAEAGLRELTRHVDAEIVIANDRLLALDARNLKLVDAFALADDMLKKAVETICDFILKVGIINVDLRDVTAILTNGGRTMFNVAEATGEERALAAAQAVVTNPLLDVTLEGATGLLLNIEGSDLSIGEVSAAAELIARTAAPDANIIWGYAEDPALEGRIKITLIATGYRVDEKGRIRTKASPEDSPIDLDLNQRPFDPLDLDVPPQLRR